MRKGIAHLYWPGLSRCGNKRGYDVECEILNFKKSGYGEGGRNYYGDRYLIKYKPKTHSTKNGYRKQWVDTNQVKEIKEI